jgi:NAD(P)H-dependent flavin oxidoreductase YrpB (nitropropane dioxygenase family)
MAPGRLATLLDCAIPLQVAGMGGCGTVALAAAVARAGGIGTLPVLGPSPIAGRVAESRDAAGGGVIAANVLMPFLDRAAAVAAARAGAAFVECFYGAPEAALVAAIHDAGALAAWQVGSVAEADAAVAAGCDLVIAQGVEAGGHVRGTVPLHELVPAVRAAHPVVPLVAAGGLATGADIAAVLALGADGARLGTRFLLTPEADVHPAYRDALLATRDGDAETVLTTAFGAGWPDAPHRVLRACVDAASAQPEGAPWRWSPAPPTASATDPAAMAMYAGTGVGAIDAVEPAEELTRRLWADASVIAS